MGPIGRGNIYIFFFLDNWRNFQFVVRNLTKTNVHAKWAPRPANIQRKSMGETRYYNIAEWAISPANYKFLRVCNADRSSILKVF